MLRSGAVWYAGVAAMACSFAALSVAQIAHARLANALLTSSSVLTKAYPFLLLGQ
jgi:hypothetical protein